MGDAAACRTALGHSGPTDRLHLVGHGDIAATTLAEVDGRTWADGLYANGLRNVRRISLVACLAGNEDAPRGFRSLLAGTPLGDNFAQALLRRLGEHGVYTEVAARTELVFVLPNGHKVTAPHPTPPGFVPAAKRPGTKKVFSWNAARTALEVRDQY